MAQKPPIRIDAPNAGGSEAATFIFLHGFGDDAEGWVNIAQQFHSANKLPYLNWVFPNAPHNHEAIANAWYPLTSFSPIPVGRSSHSQDPTESDENDDDELETESEILKSVEYICSLIDEEVKRGVSLKRIVVGGFSQGCAVSLVMGLASRYGGRIAGVVGLSGYLPHGKQIRREREGYAKVAGEGEMAMRVFLGHGTKDMLVPMRMFRDAKARVATIVGEENLEAREYTGMGHVSCGPEFQDICTFLEKIVPQ